jgi:ubiquinone/menaquinone biosynthesis C-methylase UbiE
VAIDHFGLLAPFYDRLIKYAEAEVMIRRLGLPVEGRLLDAGGGTGRVAAALKGLANQIVVADLSVGMLRQAAAKGLQITCGITEGLPFPDATFERIIMVDALHHVHNRQATARELWRALVPGGRILVVEPDLHFFGVKLIALFEKLMLMRSHFLPPEAIAGLFRVDGAKICIERDGTNGWITIENVRPG